jgi:hypothetical protein
MPLLFPEIRLQDLRTGQLSRRIPSPHCQLTERHRIFLPLVLTSVTSHGLFYSYFNAVTGSTRIARHAASPEPNAGPILRKWDRSQRTPLSLVLQCPHGIDARGMASGYVARSRRHKPEQKGDTEVDDRISRTDAKEQAAHQLRERKRGGKS